VLPQLFVKVMTCKSCNRVNSHCMLLFLLWWYLGAVAYTLLICTLLEQPQ